MTYEAMNYDHLKGGVLKGFSDSQLDLHFTLYKGYLAKLNETEGKPTGTDNIKWSEVSRRCRAVKQGERMRRNP